MLYMSPEKWAERLVAERSATCTVTDSDDLVVVVSTLVSHAKAAGRRIRVFHSGPSQLTAVDVGPLPVDPMPVRAEVAVTFQMSEAIEARFVYQASELIEGIEGVNVDDHTTAQLIARLYDRQHDPVELLAGLLEDVGDEANDESYRTSGGRCAMTFEPVYDRDGITLYHGDCMAILPTLLVTVDAVLGDLPYGVTRNDWDRPLDNKLLWHHLRGLCGPRTPICLFGTGMFYARLLVSNEDEYRYDLVWDKDAVTGYLNAKKQPLRCHENIGVFYRQQPRYEPQFVYTGRSAHSRGTKTERTVNNQGDHVNTPVARQDGWQHPRSILRFKRPKLPKGVGHPTQKPVDLMEWMVLSYTAEGDLIVDPVCGVGSTLVAARNQGRRAIGIELHEPYIEQTIARLESGSEGDRW